MGTNLSTPRDAIELSSGWLSRLAEDMSAPRGAEIYRGEYETASNGIEAMPGRSLVAWPPGIQKIDFVEWAAKTGREIGSSQLQQCPETH